MKITPPSCGKVELNIPYCSYGENSPEFIVHLVSTESINTKQEAKEFAEWLSGSVPCSFFDALYQHLGDLGARENKKR